MKIDDLTQEQMEKIADDCPFWMAVNRPDWMAKYRPFWMAANYPDLMAKYRPDLMAANSLFWIPTRPEDNEEVPKKILKIIKE